ncbi:hypothetical protein [Buttiauxella sp. S04-F03]|uniref:hypothetical protein n=1 Tax=Buttiauxella sp. S04-F03 TaxID=2904525 RepID=UPI001E28B20F|nr:hypothetical protein [Buttiauxella sp. S04-F03]MCE0813701.1 hypothetical protein [Buttiauxella sp. S04-F03]
MKCYEGIQVTFQEKAQAFAYLNATIADVPATPTSGVFTITPKAKAGTATITVHAAGGTDVTVAVTVAP